MMLIELIAYIAMLSVVMIVIVKGYSSCQQHSRQLAGNVYDIKRTLAAGELWRRDMRSATAAPYCKQGTIFIPQHQGMIAYKFIADKWQRKASDRNDWDEISLVLKTSRMLPEKRQYVKSWRWELELSCNGNPHVRPLFTFIAVPGLQTPRR